MKEHSINVEVELKTAYQNYIDQQETDKSKLIEEISKLKDELWNKQRNYEGSYHTWFNKYICII